MSYPKVTIQRAYDLYPSTPVVTYKDYEALAEEYALISDAHITMEYWRERCKELRKEIAEIRNRAVTIVDRKTITSAPDGWMLVPTAPDRDLLVRLSVLMGVEPLREDEYPITGRQSTVRSWYDAVLKAANHMALGNEGGEVKP